MTKVSLYDYYSFGFNYYILLNNSSNKTNENFNKDLASYISFVKRLDLRVTLSLLNMNGWEEVYEEAQKMNKGAKKKLKIEAALHKKMIDIINKADPTLDAELNIKTGYILSEKRIISEKLTGNISSIFSQGTYSDLPDIARFDFAESGKCIAFDRHTASAFHSLRGTEDVLKTYYSLLTGKKPTDSQTWWNFYNEIENEIKAAKITPHPPKELMQNLDSLRVFYRNKTQHPQLTYNSDEAQDLLFNCIKCVNQIIKDLKDRKLIDDFPF